MTMIDEPASGWKRIRMERERIESSNKAITETGRDKDKIKTIYAKAVREVAK